MPSGPYSRITNVRFTEEQHQVLRILAQRADVKISTALRAIVNLWLAKYGTGATFDLEDESNAHGRALDVDLAAQHIREQALAEELDDLEQAHAESREPDAG
jgi:hypothetical protein